MKPAFDFRAGELPLLISVPHDGREIPADMQVRMTDAGRAIPDTDWHVTKLYEFAVEMGANVLAANYSRYVVDLNRPADDGELYPGQVSTGLCPLQTFSGDSIYRAGGVDDDEKSQRIEQYWRPYHEKISTTLEALRTQHGYALLWDAHSIPSVVPRLFDGELPELNLGSNSGASCGESMQNDVAAIATASCFSTAINGRFTGGYITRHYSDPEHGVHALQLEIAQRAYMNEQAGSFDVQKAATLRATLRQMLDAFLTASLPVQ